MAKVRPVKWYTINITDADVITAYSAVADIIAHTDAPSELELCRVRAQLQLTEPEMLSLHWLRNRIVALRKSNRLPKQ